VENDLKVAVLPTWINPVSRTAFLIEWVVSAVTITVMRFALTVRLYRDSIKNGSKV